MGCWNESCAITRLPIFSGEKVVAFVICMDDFMWHGMSGKPYLACFHGTYNDYGSLEELEDTEYDEYLTKTETGKCAVDFNLSGDVVHVKQYQNTVFIKENVFNQVINFVDKKLQDDWKLVERFNIESVYPDLYYKNIESIRNGFTFIDNKNKLELIKEIIPEEFENMEKFCKLILFCEKTRIDLRNAVYGKGHNCDGIEEYKFLKGILNREFDNYLFDNKEY